MVTEVKMKIKFLNFKKVSVMENSRKATMRKPNNVTET